MMNSDLVTRLASSLKNASQWNEQLGSGVETGRSFYPSAGVIYWYSFLRGLKYLREFRGRTALVYLGRLHLGRETECVCVCVCS